MPGNVRAKYMENMDRCSMNKFFEEIIAQCIAKKRAFKDLRSEQRGN